MRQKYTVIGIDQMESDTWSIVVTANDAMDARKCALREYRKDNGLPRDYDEATVNYVFLGEHFNLIEGMVGMDGG